MHQVEDEPMETIHLYVVREGEKRPSLTGIIISVFALSILIAIGVLTPYKQPEQRAFIRVPAVLLPLKVFTASVAIIPTGVKTYPATYAHGILTFTNGSIIGQTIPQGFVVDNVVTDESLYVPGATADGFAVATVKAHSSIAGVNLAALSVDVVIGSSLFIRNLSPFIGGHPAYSVKYATSQNRHIALEHARQSIASQISGLHYPCIETITTLLIWKCSFVTYHIPPSMHVLNVTLQGRTLLITVWFIAHPRRIWVK